MKNRFTWLTASHFMAAFVTLCLVAAPLSANCCAQLSCQRSPTAASPESPCHGAMGEEHHRVVVKYQGTPRCSNEFLALQNDQNVEPAPLNSLQETHVDSITLGVGQKVSSQTFETNKRIDGTAEPARSNREASSIAPLKL